MYISTAPAVLAGSSVLTYQLVSSTTGPAHTAGHPTWSPILMGLAALCLLYAFVVRAARRQGR